MTRVSPYGSADTFSRANELIGPLVEKPKQVRCISPDHEDRRPSMFLTPDGFKCFSCGAWGDRVDYVAVTQNMTIGNVLHSLGLKRQVRVRKKRPRFSRELVQAIRDGTAPFFQSGRWRVRCSAGYRKNGSPSPSATSTFSNCAASGTFLHLQSMTSPRPYARRSD